jgi:hypothetical protein
VVYSMCCAASNDFPGAVYGIRPTCVSQHKKGYVSKEQGNKVLKGSVQMQRRISGSTSSSCGWGSVAILGDNGGRGYGDAIRGWADHQSGKIQNRI